MARVYSRQLFWGYMAPGFASYSAGPSGEVWVITDVLCQFQNTGAHIDLALFDGTNWASLIYADQTGAELNVNVHGMHVSWEEGQALVAAISTADCAVLLSGFKLLLP